MKKFRLKEPGSAITHFIGFIYAFFSSIPLLIISGKHTEKIHIISMSIYSFSIIALYAASTLYHSLDLSQKGNQILKKLDHSMISVLVAGTYTPICLIALKGNGGIILLTVVWTFALLGVLMKLFWVNCPKWISSVLYIAMGWSCLISFSQILDCFPLTTFLWLLSGGIIYTLGGIIYGFNFCNFDKKHKNFGSHEIFHLFIMGGSFCFSMVMYLLVI